MKNKESLKLVLTNLTVGEHRGRGRDNVKRSNSKSLKRSRSAKREKIDREDVTNQGEVLKYLKKKFN